MHPRFPLVVSLLASLALCTNADAARARHHAKPHLHYEIRINSVTAPASYGALRSDWVQEGPNGLEARAVLDSAVCPEISVDGHDWIMDQRAAADEKFATFCSAKIPTGSKQAALVFRKPSDPPPNVPEVEQNLVLMLARLHGDLDIVPLPLPPADPQRIVVFGDTGCRIKGKELQDCSDPEKWPFPQIAAEAAKLKPDLVIHVGDYLYRENACPADFKGCAGTPFGDNWDTWNADFFVPAAPLLAVAPWVFVRGNHEECDRAGPGWLRLLGPLAFDPAVPCAAHLAPYSVPLGSVNLVVMDDANAPETSVASGMVPVLRGEIASLASAAAPSWLVVHRPIWAAISGPLGIPAGGNQTLIAAIGGNGIPSPVELMLSGHIHSFEAINYGDSDHVPPQIVAGFGGDALVVTPPNLKGAIFQGDSGVHVKDGLSLPGFGFLLLTKNAQGWAVDVYDVHGAIERRCLFQAGRVDCPKQR
jgi:hypothetical protein